MRNRPYDLYKLPEIESLKDMLEQKAASRPERIAFAFFGGKNRIKEKSFRNFRDDVNALGTWMYRQGIRDKHIAVIGENSYEWLLCFFAAAAGGNVAVPVDKELPPEEIEELLHKADVEIVFVSETYRSSVTGAERRVYSMAHMEQFAAAGRKSYEEGDRSFAEHRIESSDLCCIMYTSGTSGKSKGVMLSHGNIAAEINSACRLFALEGNTMALLPFHHAFGLVVGILMVYNYGFTNFINKSLKAVREDLQTAAPQTMILVPLFVETFHKQIWAQAKKEGKDRMLRILMKISDCLRVMGIDIRRRAFASVRSSFGGKLSYIICGGAPLMPQYVKEFRSFGVEIINGYGTTECSPCAAANRNYHHKDGTVGIAVPDVSVKVSEDGEVLIKGPIVMQGYYKDEESTKQAIKDGWYATGDLGTIDSDGFITLTGRKKNLIILSNGENISPEGLEEEFLRDEAVQEVLVYEEGNLIAAEIYPAEGYLGNEAYFNILLQRINRSRPLYKQVNKILLRSTEFPKNTSKKILRYRR